MQEVRKEDRETTKELIIEIKKDINFLKFVMQDFEDTSKEANFEALNIEHLAKIKNEYFLRRGIIGTRIQEYEVYKKIREAEKYSNIETDGILQDLKNISNEYNPELVKRILEIYDGYIEQLDDKHCLEAIRELNKLIKEKSTRYSKTNDFINRISEICKKYFKQQKYIKKHEEIRQDNYIEKLTFSLEEKEKIKSSVPKSKRLQKIE